MAEPAKPGAKGGTDFLKKQVGPLPIGIWIIVVGSALVLAWYINSRRKAAASGETEGADGEIVLQGGQAPSMFLPSGPPSQEPILTNEAWAIKAVGYLIGKAGTDPYSAQAAVRKYLQGEDITQAEKAYIDDVLKNIGPPPILPTRGSVIIGIPPAPPPPAPPPPGPAPSHAPIPTHPTYGYGFISVPIYQNLYDWTGDVSRGYGVPYSINIMRALNPGIEPYIYWDGPDGSTKTPYFKAGTPPVKIV